LNEADLKIRALYRQGLVYQDVYNHLKNVENGYLKLFELERQKFDSGDGTIFLLNTRENRYLNARIKTIEQKSKYIHTVLDYLRATGKISQSIFGTDGL
jgi:outer membrane protein TolC